jgi:CRISPR-associated endonuclease/helicase Cas3
VLHFRDAFRAITGFAPLAWQQRLHDDYFARDRVPASCSLPTGLGKTSVVPIWLIALAGMAGKAASKIALPRRLVYIVNRRTVVDQATESAKRLLAAIYMSAMYDRLPWATADGMKALGLELPPRLSDERSEVLRHLRKNLASLSVGGGDVAKEHSAPLAVSTLRGELADNGEWKKNPARPAIIIGTIDMIGSKLLFSGYGDGRYGRAHHAGLIGQDALIVHDESHLSPAFDALLRSVAAEQARSRESRPIRVMSLSATTRVERTSEEDAGCRFGVEKEDHGDPVVLQRLGARKVLKIVEADKGKTISNIVEHARRLGKEPARVLVYVRSPETASDVAALLVKELGHGGESRVKVLTGTMRGKERDELATSNLFSAFKSDADRSQILPHALYLVSTSAGEVGADLDADHLVCDLSTLDSMTQRFGRVNRLGGDQRSAQVVVVIEKVEDKKASSLSEAISKTSKILRTISERGGDVSPAGLGKVLGLLSSEEVRAAYSPMPTILPATDILFDHWSLTSIVGELPGRPPVEPYLHGVADWEPPETYIAWRADICELSKAGGKDADGKDRPCSPRDLEEVFEVFPLRSVEQLRERSDRAMGELQKLAERHPDQPVVIMKGGGVRWTSLAELVPQDTNQKNAAIARLAYATVVLPTDIGGLSENGTLDGGQEPPRDPVNPHAHRALDVAEQSFVGAADRQRVRISASDRSGEGTPLLGDETIAAITRYSVTLVGDEDEGTPLHAIEYRVVSGEEREPGIRLGLDAHNAAVGVVAARMAKALGLPDDLAEAVALAGRHHDTGKGAGREIWQRYALSIPHQPGDEIAKSYRYGHWKSLGGYRHEFGSLLDASFGPSNGGPPNVRVSHPERDLILHLIAAHHGWARPHFEPRHFDPGSSAHPRTTTMNERAAIEAMQRFARLQERFGRWGLAWLESLVRCADAEASDAASAEGGRT